MSLVPEQLKHPWPLVPLCVISLALGMLLWCFILFPTRYMAIHERMLELHLTNPVAAIGTACISLPLMLLSWCINSERDDC